MTDRELLELAAKAAGLTLETSFDVNGDYWPWCHDYERNWCPITDDGDALRLATELHLGVIYDDVFVNVFRCGHGPVIDLCETYGSDPYAATRRAIVRAAAAIEQGK